MTITYPIWEKCTTDQLIYLAQYANSAGVAKAAMDKSGQYDISEFLS